MILYHYTAAEYLRGIAKEGLTVGDVPTDIKKHRGRIGVWLTTAPDPDGHGLAGSRYNKKGFRIEVEIDDSSPLHALWSEWSLKNVTSDTRRILSSTATDEIGRDFTATWSIYFGWVKPERLLGVTDTSTGKPVKNWATYLTEEQSVRPVSFRNKGQWQKRMFKDLRHELAKQSR